MTKAVDELGFLFDQMGCGGSKVDELALVVRCRERKQLIRAAADHRYALAAAHLSYFKSLQGVGDALRQFVQEEILIVSPPPSPVLTLPSDEGKPKKRHTNSTSTSGNHKSTSSPTSLSHADSGSTLHLHDHDHERDDSHIHSSGSDSDSELSSPSGQFHQYHPQEESMPPFSEAFPQTAWGPYGMNSFPSDFQPFGMNPYPNPSSSWSTFGMNPYPTSESGWDPYSYGINSTSHAYHMKKSAPAVQTVIYDPDNSQESGQVPPESSSYIYSTSYTSNPYQHGGGYFGFPMGAPPPPGPYENKQPSHPPPSPPPPPSPQVSSWDYFNPFNMFDNNNNGYAGYYSQNIKLEFSSIASSPDTNEVREREGIPELEDETESEAIKEEVLKGKKVSEDVRRKTGEGTSRSVKSRKKSSESSSKTFSSKKKHNSEDSPRRATFQKENGEKGKQSTSNNGDGSTYGFPSQTSEAISIEPTSVYSEKIQSVSLKEGKSSLETTMSEISEDVSAKRKSVTFEVGSDGMQDVESSNFSSLTTIYAHGTRDLNDVVEEIENEFKTASTYGMEVASMLEVGKLPYQPRFSLLKVILSRILYLVAPTVSYPTPPSKRSVTLDLNTTKLAKSYLADSGNMKTLNFSSTLDKLYAWEKKLYKEVKDEERLRLIYEKQCRRLKLLDDRGAESSKIDATQASISKLLMKLDVCIRAVDSISRRIHKVRDEELQPQVTELVRGLIRMWRDMLKCHQKQFQAIMESKLRRLRAANTLRRDSSLKATIELEFELRTWCNHFRAWMNNQRSFIESLNKWLLRCLHYEPEQSSDGLVPFSPGRIGAPPVFVVCNDWFQAMETISERGVEEAVDKFASILRQLCEESQEEEKGGREQSYISPKDFEKRVKSLQSEGGKRDKTGGSMAGSDGGVSVLDDLKVDLDLMRKRLQEERARQKKKKNKGSSDSMSVNSGTNSLQASLVPIFEALGNFTSQVLKAYESVRTPKPNDAKNMGVKEEFVERV